MKRHVKIIVVGVSTGGTEALQILLPRLPADYPVPLVVVQHIHAWQDDYLARHYNSLCMLTVQEANEKELPRPGTVYLAPANYHLLLEADGSFSLSIDPKVHFARPSIDVLFESAADVFGTSGIGVILTGANHDGATGLRAIEKKGGQIIVQDPTTAVAAAMPQAAIAATHAPRILSLAEIGTFLVHSGTHV